MNLLTQHLNTWTTAPNGIKKLRELILELAVRGLLVPQNLDDEPASVLLEKIAAEKARLIAEGKIKKSAPLPKISDDEKPFDLPDGWEYSRFGNVSINRDGERIPVSSDERQSREKIYDYYGASGVIDKIDNFLFDKTLLLIGEDGANLINRSTPIAFLAHGKYWVNNHAHVIDAYCQDLMNYLCLYINAISLEPYVTGTAQPKMNQAKLNSIVINLPPLTEQHRIVAKVDELMQLCDQLEQKQTSNQEIHAQLVSTLLTALTQATDAKTFQTTWSQIAENFEHLFTTESSIEQLKQTILQLAVMGKLVEQDANDEPASVLLEKIAQEKARLISEGKIKKSAPLPKIADDEKPFDLPDGWEWVRLGELLAKIGAGSTPLGGKNVYVDKGIKFLRSQNVWHEGLKLHDVAFITESTHEKMKSTEVSAGDLLFNITGASIGRCALVPDNFDTANVSQHVTIIRPVSTDIKVYLHKLLTSQLVQKTVMDVQVGVSREGLSIGKLGQFLIPFPPLPEQHRIVAKVDELMALCDQLKTKLHTAQTLQTQLAEALVQQVI